jgi:hypothetical protein
MMDIRLRASFEGTASQKSLTILGTVPPLGRPFGGGGRLSQE